MMEEKKEQCLKSAYDCFTTVDQEKNFNNTDPDLEKSRNEDSHDEKWLYHYMLGKISEKRKEPPTTTLEQYRNSAKFLYESNATYPFRISFTNPQNLSLEALEIFYRITATIVKYVEQHAVVPRGIGKYFLKVLKELCTSPFALSQAKINENSINAFKRKLSLANEEAARAKLAKLEESHTATSPPVEVIGDEVPVYRGVNHDQDAVVKLTSPAEIKEPEVKVDVPGPVTEDNPTSPLRRGSQESTATNTTQTTTTTGSDSTSSSSSDSSSSDSSSSETDDSSSEDGDKVCVSSVIESFPNIFY